jgi:hypothetical protein
VGAPEGEGEVLPLLLPLAPPLTVGAAEGVPVAETLCADEPEGGGVGVGGGEGVGDAVDDAPEDPLRDEEGEPVSVAALPVGEGVAVAPDVAVPLPPLPVAEPEGGDDAVGVAVAGGEVVPPAVPVGSTVLLAEREGAPLAEEPTVTVPLGGALSEGEALALIAEEGVPLAVGVARVVAVAVAQGDAVGGAVVVGGAVTLAPALPVGGAVEEAEGETVALPLPPPPAVVVGATVPVATRAVPVAGSGEGLDGGEDVGGADGVPSCDTVGVKDGEGGGVAVAEGEPVGVAPANEGESAPEALRGAEGGAEGEGEREGSALVRLLRVAEGVVVREREREEEEEMEGEAEGERVPAGEALAEG